MDQGRVEFQNIDSSKMAENIYEPAPGEITIGNGRPKSSNGHVNESFECLDSFKCKSNIDPFVQWP